MAAEQIPGDLQGILRNDYPQAEISSHIRAFEDALCLLLQDGKTVLVGYRKEDAGWRKLFANTNMPEYAAGFDADSKQPWLLTFTLSEQRTMQWRLHRDEDTAWYIQGIVIQKAYPEQDRIVKDSFDFYGDVLIHSYQFFYTDIHTEALSDRRSFPMKELQSELLLERFTYEKYPWLSSRYMHSYLESAARELFPNARYIDGILGNDFQILAEKPGGELVLYVVTAKDDVPVTWDIVESTPLPKGSRFMDSTSHDTLMVPQADGNSYVQIRKMADSRCMVHILNESTEYAANIAPQFVSGEPLLFNEKSYVVGSSDWDDIRSIEWTHLPKGYEETVERMDLTNWAIVKNPNPEDRLHLREKKDRSSASKGKYYNGTPVKILDRDGEWCRVDVLGEQGYMMEKYLTPSTKDNTTMYVTVNTAYLQNSVKYDKPMGKASSWRFPFESGIVIALIEKAADGREWVRIWVPSVDETGYMPLEEVFFGNG